MSNSVEPVYQFSEAVQEKLDNITVVQRTKARAEYQKIWEAQVDRYTKYNISISDDSEEAESVRDLYMNEAIKIATKKPKKKLSQRKKIPPPGYPPKPGSKKRAGGRRRTRRRKRSYHKGSPSKTRRGRQDFITHLGSKVYDIMGHYLALKKKPYTRRRRHRRHRRRR